MATNKPGRVDSASSGNRPPSGGKKPGSSNIAGTSYSKENKQGQTSSSNKPVRVDTVSGAASGRDNRPSSSFSSAGSSGKTNSSGKTSSGKSSSGSSGKSSSGSRKNTSSSSRKSASSRKTGTVFDTLASQEKNPKKPPADSVAAAIHKPRFTVNNTQKEDTEETTSAPQKPNPLTGSYPSASGGSDGENPSANNTYTPPYQAYYEGGRVTGEEYGKLGSQLERVYNPGDKGYHTEGIYRGANGNFYTQQYIDKHPDQIFYPMNWVKHIYKSYTDENGILRNHRGEAWGDKYSLWTLDEMPDHAKAEWHHNYGIFPGDFVPNSEDYVGAYKFLNDAYGVAADDTHILSDGLTPGQGYYWKNGGDGITNKPVYTPIGTYTIPGDYSTGGGEMQQMTANLTSKANPNTGMSGGDMMAYYRQAMADAMEEEAAAYERQIESQVRALNAQKDPLEQQYNKSAQQAYIQSELAKKNLPQQLAAQGLNGGASESANLAIETGYGNALNQLTQDYNNNLAALDLQIQQLRANGEIAKAQALSQYKQQMAAAYLQQAQQQQSLQNQMALLNYQNQLEQQNKASTSGGYTGPDDDVRFGGSAPSYGPYQISAQDAISAGVYRPANSTSKNLLGGSEAQWMPSSSINTVPIGAAGATAKRDEQALRVIQSQYNNGQITREEAARRAALLGYEGIF